MLTRNQIERVERDINALTARIHETFNQKQKSDIHWDEWEAVIVAADWKNRTPRKLCPPPLFVSHYGDTMKRPLLSVVLILLSITNVAHAQTEPAKEAPEVIERRDAAASALARSIYEQLPVQDGFNQPHGTERWSWDVTYQPQYGTITVERAQAVLMEAGAVINGDGKRRPPTMVRPSFTLLIEPFISPAEYARFKAENDATHKQLGEMYKQMTQQRINHKFDSFLPRNDEEKKKVEAYDNLKRNIHHLPDYYFRDISVSWVTYNELFHYPGETPTRFIVRDDEQESWRREQAQAVQAVLKIVSHYKIEAK